MPNTCFIEQPITIPFTVFWREKKLAKLVLFVVFAGAYRRTVTERQMSWHRKLVNHIDLSTSANQSAAADDFDDDEHGRVNTFR